jgi:hypothetical protein
MNAVQKIEEQQQLPAAQDERAAVMNMIERAATDPNFDVTKLEKLMSLQEHILNRNAKQAFAADYVLMKPHLPKVLRRKENTQTKSKYAPLEDINVEIDPVLEKYGFGTATKIIAQTDTSVTVKAELWHRGGHVEETTITMPLDKTGIAGTVNKTLPHATSSSVTYAKRVAICALLNISTGDDKDGNHETGNITIEQAAELDKRARALGEEVHQNFLKYMKVEKAIDIPAKNYKQATVALAAKEKERDKENKLKSEAGKTKAQ